jgi:hypothetical protein
MSAASVAQAIVTATARASSPEAAGVVGLSG